MSVYCISYTPLAAPRGQTCIVHLQQQNNHVVCCRMFKALVKDLLERLNLKQMHTCVGKKIKLIRTRALGIIHRQPSDHKPLNPWTFLSFLNWGSVVMLSTGPYWWAFSCREGKVWPSLLPSLDPSLSAQPESARQSHPCGFALEKQSTHHRHRSVSPTEAEWAPIQIWNSSLENKYDKKEIDSSEI